MRNNNTKTIALSGMLAAVALVIMCLGGMIPLATYICPMLCAVTACLVMHFCGRRLAWVWYAAVAILSLLLSPDKEAAGVFLLLGYYPMVKPVLERSRLRILWKLLLFNGAVALLYGFLLKLMGVEDMADETFGLIGLAVMLLLGNLTFFLMDRVLTMIAGKLRRKGK